MSPTRAHQSTTIDEAVMADAVETKSSIKGSYFHLALN